MCPENLIEMSDASVSYRVDMLQYTISNGLNIFRPGWNVVRETYTLQKRSYLSSALQNIAPSQLVPYGA